MSEHKEKCQRIGGIVMCREKTCGAMFSGLPEGFSTEMQEAVLPCGHKVGTVTVSGTVIKGTAKAEDMLVWLENNGMILSEASRAAKMAGGSFEDVRGDFSVPLRDLTDEEYEDILFHVDPSSPRER